jgi:hypothetical protein
MEIILSQSFKWVRIYPLRDYCRISDKDEYLMGGKNIKYVHFPNKPQKKQTDYYYIPKDEHEVNKDIFSIKSRNISTNFMCYIIDKRGHYYYDTQNQNQVLRHFNRPFSSIELIYIERSIIRDGDKIYLKNKKLIKRRDVNKKYFKRHVISTTIVFDTKKGNFKVVNFNKNGKNKSTKITTNTFRPLKTVLVEFFNIKKFQNTSTDFKFSNECDQIFDDLKFRDTIFRSLNINTNLISKVDINDLYIQILNFFIQKKQIKIPNSNWEHLITNYYPTEKYLKKNDRKLIASVLDMFGYKSKQTIKLLHTHPNLSINCFIKLCSLFGKDYNKFLSQIDQIVFQKNVNQLSLNYTNPFYDTEFNNKHQVQYFLNLQVENDYTIEEKKFILIILNSVDKIVGQNILNIQFLDEIKDHINMYRQIKLVDPYIAMNSRNLSEFREEHMQFSKLCEQIKKGWVTEYVYDEKTTNEIEVPFEIENNENGVKKLYPKILKREEEYIEEGSFMHHCVASYANKDRSIIISIRTKDKNDRVTTEYDIQTGAMLQARYFCNGKPPEIYDKVLFDLTQKVSRMARYGVLNWKEKKKVKLKINDIEIDQIQVEEIF